MEQTPRHTVHQNLLSSREFVIGIVTPALPHARRSLFHPLHSFYSLYTSSYSPCLVFLLLRHLGCQGNNRNAWSIDQRAASFSGAGPKSALRSITCQRHSLLFLSLPTRRIQHDTAPNDGSKLPSPRASASASMARSRRSSSRTRATSPRSRLSRSATAATRRPMCA